jgi:uncharacterized protein YqgC (DUF456 family)
MGLWFQQREAWFFEVKILGSGSGASRDSGPLPDRQLAMHMPDLHPYLPTLWWSLVVLLMVVGLIGTLLPLLPGTTLILAGAVLHKVAFPSGPHTITWWTVAGLVILTLATYAVDFISGAVGAKYFGATRWGAVGGFVGAIVGMFFFPLGLFLGPLLGVLLGEVIGGKELIAAGKSSWGSLLGTTAGMIGKLVLAFIMVAWFALDVMV